MTFIFFRIMIFATSNKIAIMVKINEMIAHITAEKSVVPVVISALIAVVIASTKFKI